MAQRSLSNGRKRRGFEPLGLTQAESQLVAQHILADAVPHIASWPDDQSRNETAVPISGTFISVKEDTLRNAGLSDHAIARMKDILHHPLDSALYDGPEVNGGEVDFVFIKPKLEEIAETSMERTKRYAPLFEHNGRHGLFKGIQAKAKGR